MWFQGEDWRGKVPTDIKWYRRYLISIWFITVGVNLNHFALHSVSQISPLQSYPFPPLSYYKESNTYAKITGLFNITWQAMTPKHSILTNTLHRNLQGNHTYHRSNVWHPCRISVQKAQTHYKCVSYRII